MKLIYNTVKKENCQVSKNSIVYPRTHLFILCLLFVTEITYYLFHQKKILNLMVNIYYYTLPSNFVVNSITFFDTFFVKLKLDYFSGFKFYRVGIIKLLSHDFNH